MPGDFAYPVTVPDLFTAQAYEAARRAVLVPAGRRHGQVFSYPAAYAAVLSSWRLRLAILRNQGWDVLNRGRVYQGEPGLMSLQYLRNCLPFGARFQKPIGARCHRLRICPWCYGREVVIEAFRAAEWVLTNALPRRKQQQQLQLVGMRRQFKDRPISDLPDWKTWLAETHKSFWVDYRAAIDADVTVVGAVLNATIAPGSVPHSVTVTRGAVMLVPAATAPWKHGPELKVSPFKSFTKASVVGLLAAAFPYPAGMLYGDPATAVAILQAAAARTGDGLKKGPGVKLTRALGLFANARFRAAGRTYAADLPDIEPESESSATEFIEEHHAG